MNKQNKQKFLSLNSGIMILVSMGCLGFSLNYYNPYRIVPLGISLFGFIFLVIHYFKPIEKLYIYKYTQLGMFGLWAFI